MFNSNKLVNIFCHSLFFQVLVQPSSRRAYTAKEYEKAGAVVTDDLSPADAIIGTVPCL